ncbi:uncharacterized protein BCR38DRAFT_491399 [Pseudomassariella vexata]|uniref:Alpha/Beta hydrolase protein n=1 Tax=Pseudomassariella vexata TaxID=1141098 RepID=A0A1Y2D5X3_9PEZI|nr:uncharacterized protein BCR38DRAFT_491399 [Pseudomassariella vexata]ORY54708.1 hypothetical protein BCR38DRAFT_491399 [Pseudomassariella vexata]
MRLFQTILGVVLAKPLIAAQLPSAMEQSLANGGPHRDSFYDLPPLADPSLVQPGILLKAQAFTKLTPFSVPPNTALSRILYTTNNLNGTQQFPAGLFATAGPSSHRALWYRHQSPFTLAEAGFAVVAPHFNLSMWLTPLGFARTELLREIEGGISVSAQLYLSGEHIVQDGWNEAWYADAYASLANPGRKTFRGRMLVLQGTNDIYVSYEVMAATVQDTCASYPDNDLEFIVVNGVGHVPNLDATRRTWIEWIDDRFAGQEIENKGCGVKEDRKSFLPIERYLLMDNSFTQWAGAPEYSYELPLAA